jgi:hypothetical protein
MVAKNHQFILGFSGNILDESFKSPDICVGKEFYLRDVAKNHQIAIIN